MDENIVKGTSGSATLEFNIRKDEKSINQNLTRRNIFSSNSNTFWKIKVIQNQTEQKVFNSKADTLLNFLRQNLIL